MSGENDNRALEVNVATLTEKVSNLEKLVMTLVSKAEFAPVKLIAYGLATAVLSSVLMAILATVIVR